MWLFAVHLHTCSRPRLETNLRRGQGKVLHSPHTAFNPVRLNAIKIHKCKVRVLGNNFWKVPDRMGRRGCCFWLLYKKGHATNCKPPRQNTNSGYGSTCQKSGVHAFCLTQVGGAQIEKCTFVVSLGASHFNTQGINQCPCAEKQPALLLPHCF